jgi:pyridoxine/pyridoxamine 5'-phosphate oxidase
MDWNPATLDELPGLIWAALARACGDAGDPLRTPALGTLGARGPAIRTVILRAVEPASRRLVCYTDARSAKAAEIRHEPRLAWLFYDPGAKIQIRAEGTGAIHLGDETARAAWAATPAPNRINYRTESPPGTAIASPEAAWPGGRRPTTVDAKLSAEAEQNFAVIRCTIQRLEWLRLDPAGHRRAAFEWGGNRFNGQWLVP